MLPIRTKCIQFAGILVCCLSPITARALFGVPSFVPTDRLLANTEAHLKERPDDHKTYYTLARIHYLAFVNKSSVVGAFENPAKTNSPPDIVPHWNEQDFEHSARYALARKLALEAMRDSTNANWSSERMLEFDAKLNEKRRELQNQGWKPDSIDQTEALQHAISALSNFSKALEHDPTNGLYRLGLASLCKQFSDYRQTEELKREPPELKALNWSAAKREFLLAYQHSVTKDSKLTSMPISGLRSIIAHEAATAFLQLVEASPVPASEDEKRTASDLKQSIRLFQDLPVRVVTPIIFSFLAHTTLLDLLDETTIVPFDLDGDGIVEQRPWVKPTTGIVVWDPKRTGIITSGSQLFGSVTWWIFFENGYRALDALDDDRDGFLAGNELTGISVWFDRNSNGRSDPGEVMPIEACGVKALGTRATGSTQGSPMHSGGVVTTGADRLPSYDWVVSPVQPTQLLERPPEYSW